MAGDTKSPAKQPAVPACFPACFRDMTPLEQESARAILAYVSPDYVSPEQAAWSIRLRAAREREPTPTRRNCLYSPRTVEQRQRRLDNFTGLVVKAAHGNPQPLAEYLRGGQELSYQDRDDLAWLVGQLPTNGRPRGSVMHAAIEYARCLLHAGTDAWCATHGRKRPSRKGSNAASMDHVSRTLL